MRCIMLMVRYIFLGLTILFVSVSSANAAVFDAFVGFDGLDGKTLNYQYYYPSLVPPQDPLIGPPAAYSGPVDVDAAVGVVEVNNIWQNTGTMDIDNTGFRVDFTRKYQYDNSTTYNGFELSQVSTDIPDFSAFSWTLSTNNTSFTMDIVMIGLSTIGINWQGISVNSGDYLQLEVVNAVPVPAAIWLFGTALMGFIGMSRRTRAS